MRWLVLACLGLPWVPLRAAEAPAAPEWLISADGAWVVHLSAGVAWPRCVEGMRWNGRTCQGQALHLDQAEALALAQARQKADGVAWRLPHMKELQGLARQSIRAGKAEGAWLPDPAEAWCWSATANIDTTPVNEYAYGNVARGVTTENAARLQFLHAWAVNTATGETRKDVPKRERLLVRLARPLD